MFFIQIVSKSGNVSAVQQVENLITTHISVINLLVFNNNNNNLLTCSQDNVATRNGLDVSGIRSWWGWSLFCASPEKLRGPPSFLYIEYRVVTRGKAAVASC